MRFPDLFPLIRTCARKLAVARQALTAAPLILIGLSAFSAPANTAAPINAPFSHDHILIRPRGGVPPEALAEFHSRQGTRLAGEFSAFHVQVLTVPADANVPALVAAYQASGLVEYAEPDYLRHLDATVPNDPKFVDGTLWALNNYGQSSGTAHADIDATDAWDLLSSASNIVVGVLDSGVRYTHEDLGANMWSNPVDHTHGWNSTAGSSDPNDDNTSHGTMIAGVLGAVGNNGKGVTGVAWRVQIMALKAFNNGSGTDSAILECMDFARTNGARIINASFGGGGGSLSMSNAIVALRDAGIILVASCGNGNPGFNVDLQPQYPACYKIDNVVSVAYTTRTDALGLLSNFGSTNVLLAAPGDQIYSTFAATDSYYYPPSPINLAGTSYAAGYVSGTLALMCARYPGLTPAKLIAMLAAATDPLPGLAGKCITGGRLNLRKALSYPFLAVKPPDSPGFAHLLLAAGATQSWTFQHSGDLVNWTSFATNVTSTNGLFEVLDVLPPGAGSQFYRVRNP